ncbi:F-box domain-containing protein [Mycena sanguinolenta]|uniref:F-box domain-containing protein n=1 Tax=Mycena sanguinolenta TaxID=230812 RepID=A0A8H7D9S4_9AGAR|nr:F-box domain-containing protein [Mycena sanguinolenta]
MAEEDYHDTGWPPQNTSVQPGEPLDPSPDQETHPISKLPPEILSEIFLNFLPAYPECPEHSGPLSPLLLCAICRKWRAVAMTTPKIWRAIWMTVTHSSVGLATQFELLQAWLSRSGSCPLSLDIRSYSWIHLLRESQLLQMAVLHSARWEHIDLFLTFENLHFLQCDLPLLRYLTFGLYAPSPSDTDPIDLFDRAPRLTHVVLTSNFEKSVISLPWHQLTHLRTELLYLEECVEILHEAVRLVHCDFGICGSKDAISFTTFLVHPHITHLILRLARGTSYRPGLSLLPLFENLTTPALRSLRVYEPGITPRSLQAFFSRSHRSLQELHIDKSFVPESTYHQAFPFVSKIILEEP